jgi:hypothetical protein
LSVTDISTYIRQTTATTQGGKAIPIHTTTGLRHARPWAVAHFAHPVRRHWYYAQHCLTNRPSPDPFIFIRQCNMNSRKANVYGRRIIRPTVIIRPILITFVGGKDELSGP